jgi:prepilin-type processing-associated H-X9-DG protein
MPSFKSAGGSHGGVPTLPTNGPWLDGNPRSYSGKSLSDYGKESDFVAAADTWVFIDEHHESINDDRLWAPRATSGRDGAMGGLPSAYHNKAGGLAFADGHSEIKRWKGLTYPKTGLPSNTVTPDQRSDWDWLAQINVTAGKVDVRFPAFVKPHGSCGFLASE